MKMGILYFALILIFLIPLSNGYEYNYYLTDSGSSSGIYLGLWLDDFSGCTSTDKWYYDNATFSSIEARFYDPYSNFQYYINPLVSYDTNCNYIGTDNGLYSTNNLTHLIEVDFSTNIYLSHKTICPSRNSNITIGGGTFWDVDSKGYLYNILGDDVATYSLNSNTFKACTSNGFLRTDGSEQLGSSESYSWYLPFTATYGNHYINIDATISGGCAGSGEVSIYQFNDTSIIPYTQSTVTTYSNISEVTNLIAGYPYVLIYRQTNGAGCGFRNLVLRNLSVVVLDYSPDIECSEWTDCNNDTGYISRFCEDLNGLTESYYEYEECPSTSLEFDESVFFGFYNLISYTIPICVPNWTGLYCEPFVTNKTVMMPVNWNLRDALDLYMNGLHPYRAKSWLDLSGNFNYRIWNAPPKPYEAVYNFTGTDQWECINQTTFNSVYTYYNASNNTVSNEFNISFPYENSKIWYSVKKCANQEQQFQFNDCAGFFGLGSLGDICYSGSCDDDVQGAYRLRIYKDDDNAILLNYDDNAINEWRTYYIDLSNINLETDTMYRIQFDIATEFTSKGTCIELRNFGYGISSDEFLCDSFCDNNYHYYRGYINADGICIQQDMGFSSDCIENVKYLNSIKACESFCDDNDNYHIASNLSGICEYIIDEDNELCIDIIKDDESLLPDETSSFLRSMGLGIIADATSILGIVYLILGAISLIVIKFNPNAFWMGMIFFIMFLTTFGIIPPVITIIIVFICIYLFGRGMVHTLDVD